MTPITNARRKPMNTTPPNPSQSLPGNPADETRLRAWLMLRDDLAEMHARLEYLRLMVSLRVGALGPR
jgi:hypothetical protein